MGSHNAIAASFLLGVMTIDLVFDMSDPSLRTAYYQRILSSPAVLVSVCTMICIGVVGPCLKSGQEQICAVNCTALLLYLVNIVPRYWALVLYDQPFSVRRTRLLVCSLLLCNFII